MPIWYSEGLLRDLRYFGTLEGWGKLRLESFWGTCPAIFLLSVQTLLELWGIAPRPYSLSLPRHLFLLHTLPPESSLSGRKAFFLISYSSTWSQLYTPREHIHMSSRFLLPHEVTDYLED
jgi:hypothetical protein